RTWRVLSALSASRGASDGVIGRHPARDAGPLGAEAIALEEDGERIMQEVVETMSEDEIVAMIRRTNPGVDFKKEDLSRQVYSEFYSDDGIHKTVYRVVFLLEGGRSAELIMIMKSAKPGAEITDEEIEYQRRLEAAGVRVPHFGAKIDLKEGRRIYLEEFISGPSAEMLYQEGNLPARLRNEIVRIILRAYFATGMAPNDIHRINFIISDKDGLPVLIDVGNMSQRAHSPIGFFFNMITFHGYFDIDDEIAQHFEWSMGSNFAFYDTILDEFTRRGKREEGIKLLEDVWNQWAVLLRDYPAQERGLGAHKNRVNLYDELFEYLSHLPEYADSAGSGQISWRVTSGVPWKSASMDAGATLTKRQTQKVERMVESLQQALSGKPEGETLAMVRDLLPEEEAANLALDGQVGVRLFSDEGKNKDVFLVTFRSKSGKDHQVIVALKSQKKGALVSSGEEMQLLLAHKGKPGLLKVGGHFKTLDGFDAYFVEFVPGKTIDQLQEDDSSDGARLEHARLATGALLDVYDALDGMVTTDPHRGNIVVSGNRGRLIDYDWTIKQTPGELFLRIAYHHFQLQRDFDVINTIYSIFVARYGEQKAREFLESVEAEIGAYLNTDDPDYVQARQHWYAGKTPYLDAYERPELIFPIVGGRDLISMQYALKEYLSRFIHSPPAQIPADAELSANLKGRFSPTAYFHDGNEPTATDASHTGSVSRAGLQSLNDLVSTDPAAFQRVEAPEDIASLIRQGQLIDPRVMESVEIFVVDDAQFESAGLQGPAYGLGNRIFIRKSQAGNLALIGSDQRITPFARLLIHELVARHLALRQQVAAGQGDVHHWAARNIEQQIEMAMLVNHRNGLNQSEAAKLDQEVERLKEAHSQELATIEAQISRDQREGRTAPTQDHALQGQTVGRKSPARNDKSWDPKSFWGQAREVAYRTFGTKPRWHRALVAGIKDQDRVRVRKALSVLFDEKSTRTRFPHVTDYNHTQFLDDMTDIVLRSRNAFKFWIESGVDLTRTTQLAEYNFRDKDSDRWEVNFYQLERAADIFDLSPESSLRVLQSSVDVYDAHEELVLGRDHGADAVALRRFLLDRVPERASGVLDFAIRNNTHVSFSQMLDWARAFDGKGVLDEFAQQVQSSYGDELILLLLEHGAFKVEFFHYDQDLGESPVYLLSALLRADSHIPEKIRAEFSGLTPAQRAELVIAAATGGRVVPSRETLAAFYDLFDAWAQQAPHMDNSERTFFEWSKTMLLRHAELLDGAKVMRGWGNAQRQASKIGISIFNYGAREAGSVKKFHDEIVKRLGARIVPELLTVMEASDTQSHENIYLIESGLKVLSSLGQQVQDAHALRNDVLPALLKLLEREAAWMESFNQRRMPKTDASSKEKKEWQEALK
ncbi:MAG: hypothetical protein WC547_08575, partial [Candidatus Omnitrophota bacterium]